MYEFQGVFTRQLCATLRLDHRSYTLRDLRPTYPFCGIRIHPRRDEAGDDTVKLEDAALETIDAGLTSGLALSYATFGGPIEYLAGFQIEESRIVAASRFKATFESRDDDLSELFISKMSAYGLPPERNGFFFPFERGFWGE
jgi:hypothetical protein